jgi:hypothetical protein
LALEYFHRVYFEKIINVYQQDERHENSKELEKKLSLTNDDQGWAPAWL